MKKSGHSRRWAGLIVSSASWSPRPMTGRKCPFHNQNSSTCTAGIGWRTARRRRADEWRWKAECLSETARRGNRCSLRRTSPARTPQTAEKAAGACCGSERRLSSDDWAGCFRAGSRAQAVHERDIARQKTVTAQRTTEFVKGLFEVADPQEAKGEQITVVDALDRGARQLEGELSTSRT